MTDTARRRRELFVAALDLLPDERAAFVQRACDDPALRAEILELLAIEPPDSFLAPPDLSGDAHVRPAFGPYRVETGGGHGAGPLLARHVTGGHLVEIELQPFPVVADDLVTAFVRIAHRVNELRHPGCVRVREHGLHPTGFWFARDRVDGHDLACELERQRRVGSAPVAASAILPHIGSRAWLQALLSVFLTVVEVLREAHRIGVAHGDLTAGRILLDRHGRGYVTGFGVAALSGRPAAASRDIASVCVLLHLALVDAVLPDDAAGHTHGAAAAERASLREFLRRLDPAARRPYVDADTLLVDLQRVREGRPPAPQGWARRLAGWIAARRTARPATPSET